MGDYSVVNSEDIPTPALLVFRQAVEHNIRTIGDLLGGFSRLRPHAKTHKMSQIARMQMEAGISKFKCATPKEAAMLAASGASDILLSYHIFGINMQRVIALKQSFPGIALSVIADDENNIRSLAAACASAGISLGVMVDVNTGMNRTGAQPGAASLALARLIDSFPHLSFAGLHVYDGHVGGPEPGMRQKTALESIEKGINTRRFLERGGVRVPLLVASGSPGFLHTREIAEVDEVSPGTWVFWDTGYGDTLDTPFRPAALILSRVISTTGVDLFTLDAGSKAISPDTAAPHFRVLGLPDNLEFIRRNEEHQLLRMPGGAPRPNVGETFYLVPRHVCTTVNLWDEAHVIDAAGHFAEIWPVDARGH